MKQKYIAELKAGDLVMAHGGLFKVLHDAKESQSHRPTHWSSSNYVELAGPCPVAYAEAVCLDGEIKGYFKQGTKWDFQGNFLAGKLTLTFEE
jgi:hypothetical protein